MSWFMKKHAPMLVFFILGLVLIAWHQMWFPVCHYAGGTSNACMNNLRQIDGAKQQYMLETGRTNGPVDLAAIKSYLKAETRCESGGIYTYGDLGETPVCSITNPVAGLKERVGLFGWRWKVRPSQFPHQLPNTE